jgi:integrase
MITKLTLTTLKGLHPREKRYTVWDTEDKGLGFDVTPTGHRSWLYKYCLKGKQGKVRMGSYPAMTLEQAKSRLRFLKGQMEGPEHQKPRDLQGVADPNALTVEALVTKYDQEYIPVKLKPKTQKKYRNVIKLHILPKLGSVLVSGLSESDVREVFDSLHPTPTAANAMVEVLSSIIKWAKGLGLRKTPNPCVEVERNKLPPRQKYMTVENYQAVAVELGRVEGKPGAVAGLRLILLTGMRKDEVMEMEWEWVDLQAATITIPAELHKTGLEAGQKVIHLPPEGVELLQSIQGEGRVFKGTKGGKCWEIDDVWQAVRAKVGLDSFHIHDIRHSYASMAISNGMTLEEVGPLLGHKGIRTTQRYAHLMRDKQKQNASKVGGFVAAALNGLKKP